MFYLSRSVLHDYKTTSEINDFNRSIILFEIPTRQPTCVHSRLTLWCAVFTLQCVISLLHSCLGSALTSCVKVFRCIPRASGWQVSHIHFSHLTSVTVCLHVCARAATVLLQLVLACVHKNAVQSHSQLTLQCVSARVCRRFVCMCAQCKIFMCGLRSLDSQLEVKKHFGLSRCQNLCFQTESQTKISFIR